MLDNENKGLPATVQPAPNRNLPAPSELYQAPNFAGNGGWEGEPQGPVVPLSHYLWILKRHRWKILLFVVTCVAATLIVSRRLTPIYESTATVDIDRQMPLGIIGQDSQRSAINDSDQFLATQIKLVESDSVLRPVAAQYHLLEAEGQTRKEPNANPERAKKAPVSLKNLKITRPPNTYLLQISYRSPDAQLAADVANAVAKSYVEHTYNIRFRASASLSEFMEKQLAELKAKMERSSLALAQFEKELNVINPEEKTSILSARLLQLNTEYTNAQSDRVKKEAAYNSVISGSVEAAQVSTQGELLKKLTERVDEAQEKFAEAAAHYGPNHPEYKKSQTQLTQVKQQFDAARKSTVRKVEVEYREAMNREAMLKKSVAETKAEFDRLNARSFEYQALKREADADKKLYEELVQKIKEAGINAGFQNSAIRLADSARPELNPVFPNLKLNLLLAFLFSTLLAVGAAVLSDVLDNTIRDPDQIARLLKVDAVGSLPYVKGAQAILLPNVSDKAENSKALVHTRSARQMKSGFDEAVGTLRSSILLENLERPLKSIVVTSAVPSEGKTTVATHLALAHAQQKHKTLLIDGDLRRPSIHRIFGCSNEFGLRAVVENGLKWKDKVIQLADNPELDILPAGSGARHSALLAGRFLPQILAEAVADYDLVVVDVPPAVGFPEPLQMAAAADGVLVVTIAGQTDRKAVTGLINTLQRLRANIVGIVLNKMTRDMSDSYYHYGYYDKYHKYYRSKSE